VIFDTDVLIWFFRGNSTAAKFLERQTDRQVSIISIMELYQGSRTREESRIIRRFFQENAFRIIPINPYADELFGERVYRSLGEVPFKIDIVDVFRPAQDAPEIARQAVAAGARALWLQLDIRSAEARRIAEEAGLDYVENECTAVVSSLYRIRKQTAA